MFWKCPQISHAFIKEKQNFVFLFSEEKLRPFIAATITSCYHSTQALAAQQQQHIPSLHFPIELNVTSAAASVWTYPEWRSRCPGWPGICWCWPLPSALFLRWRQRQPSHCPPGQPGGFYWTSSGAAPHQTTPVVNEQYLGQKQHRWENLKALTAFEEWMTPNFSEHFGHVIHSLKVKNGGLSWDQCSSPGWSEW